MEKQLTDILTPTCETLGRRITPPIVVTGFQSDSRLVRPGHVFFALRGSHNNGQKFVPHAISAGAVCVVSEDDVVPTLIRDHPDVVFLRSSQIMIDMADMATRFYETDHSPIRLIGITGTNGKTTTASIIHHVLKSSGRSSLFVGTTGIEFGDVQLPTDYTTPPAFEIHRLIHEARQKGITHAVLEVSSHALKLERVRNLRFDVAAFTNLTHEHAELHPSMEDYFQTKRKLFTMLKPTGWAVINNGDAYGKRLHAQLDLPKISIGDRTSDIPIQSHTDTVDFQLGQDMLSLPPLLPGEYNRINQLIALAVLHVLEVAHEDIRIGWKSFRGVEGRFEWYTGPDLDAIIDFAHTPDGLENLLTTVRSVARGKIVCVFGCPGSRDKTKRPLMGEIAARLSDRVIVTTDDIHHEDPESIIRDILAGIGRNNVETVTDRRNAIREGLRHAREGQTLVIAGRGHEKFQYVGDEKVPFLDRDVLLEEAGKLKLTLSKKKGSLEISGKP